VGAYEEIKGKTKAAGVDRQRSFFTIFLLVVSPKALMKIREHIRIWWLGDRALLYKEELFRFINSLL
jgi:hypothetical protein